MEIRLFPTQLPTPSASQGLPQPPARLQIGQIVEARVEARLGPSSYLLTLNLGSEETTLRAHSAVTLTPGQRLSLEILRLGDAPKLRLLPSATPESAGLSTLQQALRAHLPRQVALAEWTRVILETASSPAFSAAKTSPPLPETLRMALQHIIASLPTREALSSEGGLRTALANSGLFFESRLAAHILDGRQDFPEADLKARLLKLAEQLRHFIDQTTTPTPAASGLSENAQTHPGTPTSYRGTPGDTAAPAPFPTETEASIPARQSGSSNASEATVPKPVTGSSVPTKPYGETAEPPHRTMPPSPDVVEYALVAEIDSPTTPADQVARKILPEAHITDDTLPASGQTRAQTLGDPLSKAGVAIKIDDDRQTEHARPPTSDDPLDRNAMSKQSESAMTELKSLLHKTEGALARIVLNQLASQAQADGKQVFWQVNIPYTDGRHGDTAKLKITREHINKNGQTQAYWSVLLEFQPPDLGRVHSRITLIGGRIDSYFWSDTPKTERLINAHLDLLASRLQQAGLEVGKLNTLPAAPAEEGDDPGRGATNLLNERV